MKKERLNRRFFKENPLDEMSAVNFAYFQILTFENKEFRDYVREFLNDSIDKERKAVIEKESKYIENAGADELVQFMRKKYDVINREAILERALQMQEDFMPLALKRLETNRQDHFIETCCEVFAVVDTKYAEQLYEIYNNIRSPYAQSLVCLVFGLKDFQDKIPFLLDEYYRMKKMYPDEGFDQGPLFALYLLHGKI